MNYAVINMGTLEFCGVNGRYAWNAQHTAEQVASMYRDSYDGTFVVVALTPVTEQVPAS